MLSFALLLLPALATAAALSHRQDDDDDDVAHRRVFPPAGSITVCPTGCNFNTIQGAVSSIPASSTAAHTIFIHRGTYTEQVTIPVLAGRLNIYGETINTASYANNVVNLEWKASIGTGSPTDQSTSALINLSPNTAVYNINIRNTSGKGSQAVALSAYNTRQGYYGVGLYGYQDTLLAELGSQVYGTCYVEGATDFIFGQHARMWMTKTTLGIVGPGYITASGRNASDDESYYVIDQSNVKTAPGATVAPATVYLGRPWGLWARVCVQGVSLPDIINPAGWRQWNAASPNTANAIFQEWNNAGPGAVGPRAPFSTKLPEALNIATILGADYATWVDKAYI